MIKPIRCLFAFVLAVATPFAIAQTASQYAGLVISQVYGAGGNSGSTLRSDFIELFNRGTTPVNLSGASVQYASAAGTSWTADALPDFNLAPGQYYLIQESTGNGTALPTPDLIGSPSLSLSGTAGKVALVAGTASLTGTGLPNARVIDFLGFGATATPTEGGTTTVNLTATSAAIRSANGCTDTDSNGADFTVATANPRNTASARSPCSGFNAPIITTCPAFTTVAGTSGAGSGSATDADGTVNAVTISTRTSGITLGGLAPATAAGGAASVTVLVASNVPQGMYSATLAWSNDQAQSAMCTIAISVANLTPIFAIQGNGASSPLVGQTLVTQGVVTRVSYNGFYLQDAGGDGDPATSDGIFVFTTSAKPAAVKVGDLARVSASVQEFNVGLTTNADTSTHTTTELSTVTAVTVIDTGYSIAPVSVAFPPTSRDDLEKYEGMVVTFNGPFTVTGNDDEGTFGALTLAAQGRVENPTNRYRPGPAAQALNDANRLRTILLDDGVLSNPNPTPYLSPTDRTLRVGDTTPSLTGVLTYGLIEGDNTQPGNWLIAPTVEPTFARVNQRTTTPDEIGGSIRVGSANIENFFTTFTNGQTADGLTGQGCTVGTSTSASNCRGASNIVEFVRQRDKVVAELIGLNADVVGLIEVQNNGATALQNLVDALNGTLGAGVYAAVPDPAQGTGTDAIKVAMIYKPAKLARSGASVSDSNPIHNRAPLAQTFRIANGTTLTLVVNHLRSKGCGTTTGPDADQGDLQGCYNDTRLRQAQATRQFVASLFPVGPLPNVMLVGDFNSYAMEDPIVDLTSNGYVDEVGRFNAFGYSYQYAGQSGRLDQALSSQALSSKVKRAVEWHINSDEPDVLNYNLENKQPACATCSPDYYTATPYRASDHDPIVIGISLGTAPSPKEK